MAAAQVTIDDISSGTGLRLDKNSVRSNVQQVYDRNNIKTHDVWVIQTKARLSERKCLDAVLTEESLANDNNFFATTHAFELAVRAKVMDKLEHASLTVSSLRPASTAPSGQAFGMLNEPEDMSGLLRARSTTPSNAEPYAGG